jgi:hypothetical protein
MWCLLWPKKIQKDQDQQVLAGIESILSRAKAVFLKPVINPILAVNLATVKANSARYNSN